MPEKLGKATELLADSGYFSESNVTACEGEKITPYIAVGREQHNQSPFDRFSEPPSLPENADSVARMRHRLKTKDGKSIYALRKVTSEPVFGVIKAVMGFRLTPSFDGSQPFCYTENIFIFNNFMELSNKSIIKHCAAVQISNTINLLQRRAWNVLLANAYYDLPNREVFEVDYDEYMQVLGIAKRRNRRYVEEYLGGLISTRIEWNVLGKVSKRTGIRNGGPPGCWPAP